MFYPLQPAVTESGSLNDCGLDLVSESINMATVPLLMAKNTPGEEQEEKEEEREDSNPPSPLNNGLAFYEDAEEPEVIIVPTSEQTREDKLILDLKSLNCSGELLESVEKFLS